MEEAIFLGIEIMLVLFCLIYGTGTLIFSFKLTEFKGLKPVWMSYFIYALGVSSYFHATVYNVVFGNMLMTLGIYFFNEGIFKFLKWKKKIFTILQIISLFWVVIYFVFSMVSPESHRDLVLFNLVPTLTLLVITMIGISTHKEQSHISYRFLFYLNGLFCLWVLFSIFLTLVFPEHDHLTDVSDLLFLLNLCVYVVAGSLAILWLASDILSERLKMLAQKDPLTGLLNRRSMDDIVSKEFKRAERYRKPLSVMMLDIDHFKAVNDTHGHEVGDIVLREFSKTLEDQMRSCDFLFRFGGEEFLLLLTETNADAAQLVANRLLELIREKTFVHDLALKITSSIGIANPNEDFLPWENWIRLADSALYQAKEQGRNRIVTARPDEKQFQDN